MRKQEKRIRDKWRKAAALRILPLVGLLLVSCSGENGMQQQQQSSYAVSSESDLETEESGLESENRLDSSEVLVSASEENENSKSDNDTQEGAESTQEDTELTQEATEVFEATQESLQESAEVIEESEELTIEATETVEEAQTTAKPEETTGTVIETTSWEIPPAVVNPAPVAGREAGSIPRVYITTDDGNGINLIKADGAVRCNYIFLNTDGSELGASGEVKVRGNTTSDAPKKPYNIKLDEKQRVFDLANGKKWALLSECYDPTMMRNYIALDVAKQMGLRATGEKAYVEVFMDGIYRGVYLLTEQITDGKDQVDIDTQAGDFIVEYEKDRVTEGESYVTVDFYGVEIRHRIRYPKNPTPKEVTRIHAALQDAFSAVESENYETMCSKVDIDSMTKYYVMNEFMKTGDFYYTSTYFYMKDGKLFAGPVWDYDLSAGNVEGTTGKTYLSALETEGYFCKKGIFWAFFKYPEFQKLLDDTYRQAYPVFTDVYAPGGMIDRILLQNGEAFSNNWSVAGWDVSAKYSPYELTPYGTYDENIAYLRTWLQQRNEWLATEWDH